MKRVSAVLVTVAAVAATPATLAEGSPHSPPAGASRPAPAKGPQRKAAPAALTAGVSGGIRYQHHSYFLTDQPVKVTGTLHPFVAGQRVRVELWRSGHRRGLALAWVRRSHSGGVFSATLHPRSVANYTVVVVHAADRGQKAAKGNGWFSTVSSSAGPGSSGTSVRLLQLTLWWLGYPASQNGYYDQETALAVLAFRSANLMSRTDYADQSVFDKALRHQGAFKLRYPKAGRHLEFDWTRQVLVLADKGRPERVYHASSGKPSTPTVFGTFHFYRKSPGMASDGMYYSSYFIGGYAVHGYASVPTYPASHGCIRIPLSDAITVYNEISIGETIFVYQ
jgi:hypothetical protein